MNTVDPTYRYLEKFVGTYRVRAEYDVSTGDFPRDDNGCIDESFEDLYIDCSKGKLLGGGKPNQLIWYVDSLGKGRNVKRELDDKYKDKVEYEYEETDGEVLIYFDEQYLKKIATIVKPRTSGASIKPFSNKNLPKPPYEIPADDNEKLNSLLKDLERTQKMLFAKTCISEFDEEIQKKKGKRYDFAKERAASGLGNKQFIHSIGMWDDYCKFVEKKLK